MIQLTRLDGISVYLNSQNIQWIENRPDTVVTFVGGARVIVREPIEEVIRLVSASVGTVSTFLSDNDPIEQ